MEKKENKHKQASKEKKKKEIDKEGKGKNMQEKIYAFLFAKFVFHLLSDELSFPDDLMS